LAFGGAAAAWLLAGLTGHYVPDAARLPVAALAAATAGYSAFLFGQAEGSDFWQSPQVLPHLVVSAFVAGCAALLLASIAWPGTVPLIGPATRRHVAVDVVLTPQLFMVLPGPGPLPLIEVLKR